MITIGSQFPARLRFYREAQGLSMAALGRKIGTSRQVIAQWERHTTAHGPTLATLEKLAKALGVMVSHLTGELGPLEIPGECHAPSCLRAREEIHVTCNNS